MGIGGKVFEHTEILMADHPVPPVRGEHSEHCSCRLLAQTVSLNPHLVSFEYCHRVLQRHWHMQCQHGQRGGEAATEVNSES